MKNQLSHERFGALLLKINEQKEALTTQLQGGKTNLRDLATRFGVSTGSIKSALTACGIPCGHQLARSRNGHIQTNAGYRDMLTVVKRICIQLDIPAPELDKHL